MHNTDKVDIEKLKLEAMELLKNLIATPSFSEEEANTAKLIEAFLDAHHIPFKRYDNNIVAFNKYFDDNKPNILLNSHHDTVRPNQGYTRDPFLPEIEDGKLFGLGSNDAGGALVSLISLFVYFYDTPNLKYNLVLAATAEEESLGTKGLKSILDKLPRLDTAIVGEPTQMQLAIAEKGLLVLDLTIKGKSGHAAHNNNDNPILKLPKVIQWLSDYKFEKVSDFLGPVKLTITQVSAGVEHNVVPAQVNLVVDIRVNDCYQVQEIYEQLLKDNSLCEMRARSLDLNSSFIPKEHPLVKSGISLGRKVYGSSTLSDQSKLYCPSLKLGPGDSTRSHTANEYIFVEEINESIDMYIQLLNNIV